MTPPSSSALLSVVRVSLLSVVAGLGVLLGPLSGKFDLRARQMDPVVEACAGGGGLSFQQRCRVGVAAWRSTQAAVGLLAAGGADLPGSASTLGKRLESSPRISFHGRLGILEADMPDIRTVAGQAGVENGFLIWGGQAGLTVGLFDGFSLFPTMGGILSLDVNAIGDFLALPEEDGFRDGTIGYGFGARVGIFRESFTLPGVTVSGTYRSLGDIEFGDFDGSSAGDDLAGFDMDLSTTSIRVTVGKDLFGLGLLAGWGWDRYSSDANLRFRGILSEPDILFSRSGLDTERTLYYGGVTLNFLVLQLSGEVGWADGPDEGLRLDFGDHDPTAGTLFANVAFRLTY